MISNFRHVDCMIAFATVVEAGSFTGAAGVLQCSKAHVSHQVSKLEEALGVQLLFRSTRSLELTEAGGLYLGYCREVVEAVREGERALAGLKQEVGGTIRLTAPISFGETFLNEVILAFAEAYPAVRLELDLDNRIKDLKADGIDIALRTWLGSPPDDDLVAIQVGEWREVLCASASYLRQHGEIARPGDLSLHACLVNSNVDKVANWRFEREGEVFEVAVSGHMSVNNFPVLKQAVLAGAGVARLPSYLVRKELADGQLTELLPDYQAVRRPIFLVYPYQRKMPLKNRRFIDFAASWLRQNL